MTRMDANTRFGIRHAATPPKQTIARIPGVSRLTQSTNPESGTVSYAYDNDGNVSTKTDARSTLITYCYDQLNRLTGKRYALAACPLTSPDVYFQYDSSNVWGATITNPIGRL